MIWEDVTSYSRNKENSPPRILSFTDKKSGVEIIVTRHIDYKNSWILQCRALNIKEIDLKTDDIETAKEKAISMVKGILEQKITSYSNLLASLS